MCKCGKDTLREQVWELADLMEEVLGIIDHHLYPREYDAGMDLLRARAANVAQAVGINTYMENKDKP